MKKNGGLITFDKFCKLAQDLVDQKRSSLIDQCIAGNRPVLFLPVNHWMTDRTIDGTRQTVMHVFARTLDSATAHLLVKGLPIYFDIVSEPGAPQMIGKDNYREILQKMGASEKDIAIMQKIVEQTCRDDFGDADYTNKNNHENDQLDDISQDLADLIGKYIVEARKFDVSRAKKDYFRAIAACDISQDTARYEIVSRIVCNHGFQEEPVEYLRIYTNTLFDRKRLMQEFKRTGYTLASNDFDTDYPLKICRESNLVFSQWCKISEYTIPSTKDWQRYQRSSCERNFIVNLADIEDPQIDKTKNIMYSKDGRINACFDIECRSDLSGMVDITNPNNNIFNLSFSFFRWHSQTPLLKVGFITKQTVTQLDGDDDFYTIICDNERQLLQYFYKTIGIFQPDYLSGANIFGYDLPLIIYRTDQVYNMLGDCIDAASRIPFATRNIENIRRSHIYADRNFKISAELNVKGTYLLVPGLLPLDTQIIMRKLYPKDIKYGLAWFAAKAGIKGKDDMTYNEINDAYDSGDPERLYRVNKYCVQDAAICQHLLRWKLVIDDVDEIVAMSRVTNNCGHFQANGVKVRNLVMFAGFPLGYIFLTEKPKSKDDAVKKKYRGAKVLRPKIGIKREKPIAALDVNSLYPSAQRAWNLSPDKIINNPVLAAFYKKMGYILQRLLGPMANGWSVRHNNNDAERGLYPNILTRLAAERNAVKKLLEPLDERRKEIEKHHMNAIESRFTAEELIDPAIRAEILRLHREALAADEEYIAVMDKYNYYDSKQKAIKVFMNTFYGESGNDKSALYTPEMSEGTTILGQLVLLTAYDVAEEEGFDIIYGDTDSLYLEPPERFYIKHLENYRAGNITKLQYMSALVVAMMSAINYIRIQVNKRLEAMTKTNIVQMAYEEVLYPSAFIRRKCYLGIAHIKISDINFYPKPENIFVRGDDANKSNASPLFKVLLQRIKADIVSPDNEMPIKTLVMRHVKRIIGELPQMSMSNFIFIATYKSKKNNVAVHRFVERMRERNQRCITAGDEEAAELYTVPRDSDKFEFVIAKQQSIYDARGRKLDLKKGDIMEYPEVVRKTGMEIDYRYYFIKQIAAPLASYIMSAPEFFVEGDNDSFDASKDRASKYMEAKINKYFGFDAKAAQTDAAALRKSYGRTQKALTAHLTNCGIGGTAIHYMSNITSENLQELAAITAGEQVEIATSADFTIGGMLNKYNIDKLYRIYCGARGLIAVRTNYLQREKGLVAAWLRNNNEQINAVNSKYYELASQIAAGGQIKEEFIEAEDAVFIKELERKIDRYKLLSREIARLVDIREIIMRRRNKRAEHAGYVSLLDIRKARKVAVMNLE